MQTWFGRLADYGSRRLRARGLSDGGIPMSRAGSSCAKRIDSSDFLALHLRCHALLGDVALHDVWAVPLPGGGPARTVNQLRAALVGDTRPVANAAVRALFALRWWLGRAFRLDAEHHDPSGASYLHRLTNADRLQSQVSPGTRLGRFRVLYVFDNEGVGEIRNATVHAFLALALTRREPG